MLQNVRGRLPENRRLLLIEAHFFRIERARHERRAREKEGRNRVRLYRITTRPALAGCGTTASV